MKKTPTLASRRMPQNRRGSRERLLRALPPMEPLEQRVHLSTTAIPVNTPITTNSDVQQDPSIAADPLNPEHLVVSYMDRSLVTTGYAGIGVAVSEDGGLTWTTSSIPLPANFTQGAATPITQFDNQGHVFVSFSAVTFLGSQPGLTDPDFYDGTEPDSERSFGFESNNGIFVARSDDGGTTWGTPTAVVSHLYDGTDPVLFDLTPDLAVDTFAKLPNGQTNPNYGNLYEVWTRAYTRGTMPGDPTFTGGTDGMIAVSRDHGATWQIQTDSQGITSIDDPVRDLSDAPPGIGYIDQVHVTVGPAGDLYVSDYGGGDFSVLHSTDAGQTFAAPDHSSPDRLAFGVGFTSQPVNGVLDTNSFRTQTLRDIVADPSRPGVVYAVETISNTDPSGNVIDEADVYFARSTDYGVTFSSSVKVGGVTSAVLNDDNGGALASSSKTDQVVSGQAFAHFSVDASGNIAVIWYDTRVDPANHLLNVFGTVSTDGGKTFSPNFRLSDESFDADQGAFTDAIGRQDFYLGDYIGLTLANGTGYATWTDTRNGNQDIYSTQFSLTSVPAAPNDRFEPNDTIATATDLGTVFRSSLPRLQISAGDSDWYTLSPAATGQLSISATQTAASSALLKLELFDSTGTTLLATGTAVTNKAGQITGEQLAVPGSSGSTYLLHVIPVGKGTAYSLTLQSLTRNFGTSVYGQQSGSLALNDQDYYLLKAAATGTLQVNLTPGTDSTGTMSLEIVDATSLATLAAGATSGADQAATLSVKQGQSVLLHVFGDSTTAGSFNLTYTNFDQNTVASGTTFVPTSADPSQTVVADLSGNGKQDLIVSNASSDTISVLMGNGDGTFQSPHQYDVGAFASTAILTSGLLPKFRRAIAVADFNHDGIPDIVVTNYDSGDVSVLLGNGNGTFQPQRRFNAVANPFDLAVSDLTGNGISDIVTVSANSSPGLNLLQESVGVLLGRGDGTFLPPKTFTITLPAGDQYPLSSVQIADLNGDGKPDLVLSGGSDSLIRVYLGNGDGTFTAEPTFTGGQLGAGLLIDDLDGDGKPDIISASFGTGSALAFSGNGDGTFSPLAAAPSFIIGQGPIALAMADLGSSLQDYTSNLGPTDGHPDLIFANSGAKLGLNDLGPPDVVVDPTVYDDDGNFIGFGIPHVLYTGIAPQDVSVGDFNGDGVADVAVTDQDGVHIIFGATPTIIPNNTPQTAMNLGGVVHVAEPTQTIVPGHSDAYFKLSAPVEADATGDEVLDFSSLFQHLVGAGLTMQLLDSSGKVLASGDRFRVDVKQGESLTVHIFGATSSDSSSTGIGSFTLDIDALPQVASIVAESALPGESATQATSLVVTFQGDRIDPTEAQTASNYQVIYLGKDGTPGTSDDRVIPLSSGQSAIYDPGANLDVATGKVYPTAVRQTVTLLFNEVLPAGSYEIKFSPQIQSADINQGESGTLADNTGSLLGHPLISLSGGKFVQGANVVVDPFAAADQADTFKSGTPFLTQLHSDLNALLDSQLSKTGDNSSITPELLAQLMQRFAPGLTASGMPPLLVLFLDPVSLNLADPNGNHISYDLQTNKLSDQVANAFVSVTGNVEVLVMPIVAGSYDLAVSNVPETARGGVEIIGGQTQQTMALTDQIRSGQDQFTFGAPVNTSAVNSIADGSEHTNLGTNDNSGTDDASTESATPAETSSGSDTVDRVPPSTVSGDVVAISNEDLTVDDADPQQAAARKKKRQSNPVPGPTSRPARSARPTTSTAAVPDAPTNQPAVERVVLKEPIVSADSQTKTATSHTLEHPTFKVDKKVIGAVAIAMLSVHGLLGLVGGKKISERRQRRRSGSF